MQTNYTQKRQDLFKEMTESLNQAVTRSNKTSKYNSWQVIKLPKGKFYTSDGNEIEEVSQGKLIVTTGYQYDFAGIEFEDLCDLVDFVNKK